MVWSMRLKSLARIKWTGNSCCAIICLDLPDHRVLGVIDRIMPVQNDKLRFNLDADEPISVTVDASDLTGAAAEPLKGIISRYGRPISAKAFADFQQASLAELAVQLYQLGFNLTHCPTWPNGDGFPKSVVSDILAQDLRDQLEELEGVETFLLVATSREYIAVANAMRRHDKRVVIVAEEAKVTRELRLCADEFVALPPSKPERAPVTRAPRTSVRTDAARQDRAEVVRVERAPEPVKIERVVEPVRIERASEPVRVERAPEPSRAERAPEPVRVERAPEPQKVERPVETVKAEALDQTRLPNDSEVVAEVRRIVAAEGICTPRRLARALCPVDRTPTGELRSRIANRIQMLVDSGKLLREKLVVGGTSVETILVGEDKAERAAQAAETPVAPAVPVAPEVQEPEEPREEIATVANGNGHGESGSVVDLPPAMIRAEQVAEPKREQPSGNDIDAFVESFLRSAGAAGKIRKRQEPKRDEPVAEIPAVAEPTQAPEPVAEVPVAVPEGEPVVSEAPAKKSRSRRRTAPKKASTPEPESA